jgi:hypothetical protein
MIRERVGNSVLAEQLLVSGEGLRFASYLVYPTIIYDLRFYSFYLKTAKEKSHRSIRRKSKEELLRIFFIVSGANAQFRFSFCLHFFMAR